ncbi:MAG: DUF1553 domain-containing protein [Planctomycetota bacterium]
MKTARLQRRQERLRVFCQRLVSGWSRSALATVIRKKSRPSPIGSLSPTPKSSLDRAFAFRYAACFGILFSISASPLKELSAADRDAAKVTYFENHIRPLLSEHCFECHNAEKQEGGVRLDIRQDMIAGGDSGPSIVPGKPEESLLIEAVRYESLEMPPEGPLDDEDVAKLVRWVRQGAVWPEGDFAAKPSLGDQVAIREAAASHWAFQPTAEPESPAVSDPDWVHTTVDQFVLAKLDENGLAPSARAKRPTLIRRAFIDLIGLPPTPEIKQAIFGDEDLGQLSLNRIIDGLLASPHYGERMARHWMDVARYADTRDFLAAADLRYPFAYTYRDWLIHAFNQDLTFDEFVKQQIAADFLAERDDDPNLAALGFLTVGPLFRNNPHERIADRIDVVTRGLMGMTGSCARCHDHKYDPVSIEDYYSLYSVFRDSVRETELPTIESPLGREIPAELAADFKTAIAAERGKLAKYEQSLADNAMDQLAKRPKDYLLGYFELSIEKSETTRGLKSKRKLEETALTPLEKSLDRFRRNANSLSHPVFGPLAQLIAVPQNRFVSRKNAYLESHGSLLPPRVFKAVESSTSPKELIEALGDAYAAAASSEDAGDQLIRSAVNHPDEGPFHITAKAASQASRLLGKGRRKLQLFQEAIADVQATHPGAPAKAMTLSDAEKPLPTFVMYRGEPQRRGPRVKKRFPEYFSSSKQPFENGSGRLELAEKIVSPENPLTARVLVNRIWRMHFGAGLVSDGGDFGLRSDAPVQNELMDALAVGLIENGWSIKWLHRTIMNSSAYCQQSSAMNPPMRDDGTSAAEIDATNQLIWRQNRRRLDFETMRDSILAAAGTLDRSIGGRSVRLSDSPHPTRRTVYSYIDRVDPHPLFATFDVPSPDVCSAQRTETLVPQQALFAMNNPFVTDQARAIVSREDFQRAQTLQERVGILFRRALQRSPKPAEIAMMRRFIDQARSLAEDTGAAPVWQYGFGDASDASSFHSLPHFDGERYSPETKFPSGEYGYLMLNRAGGHPGKTSEQASILRWIAPEDMVIRLAGLIERKSDRGNGIEAIVRIDQREVFRKKLVTGSEKSVAGFHSVKAGQTVDFVVDPLGNSNSDGYRWTVLVEQRDASKKEVVRSWRSAQDFAPPPPPAMSPWEQAAQALMMTNEFLFVD